ncbi:hypothetical protein BS47DRAFT_1338564 [Hydnum rufescens UP504]|uniref:Uncharacterized protein n=1 Tax=Hydnum rufescens UP504 TaxID=1448309 RepID=A0A9P6E0M9_9AGAM|nr:hypothetical protein BS47DRAFT_1338564 [Hydnum rufescens UP504]
MGIITRLRKTHKRDRETARRPASTSQKQLGIRAQNRKLVSHILKPMSKYKGTCGARRMGIPMYLHTIIWG